MIANNLFAYGGPMNDTSDRDLIKRLTEHTGLAASAMAAKAKLAVSTLTRPLNHDVGYSLSKATIDKLKTAFPDFPDWAKTADLPVVDPEQEYLPVEILPSYAGMGGGGTGDGDAGIGLIPRRLIVDELRAKPSDMLIIEARGESMEPDFLHGDQILIDRRDINPVQPGSFALWDGDGYVVKLVERVPHKPGYYRIFSANGRYSAYEVEAEQVKIMGRPVWFGRRI